MFDAKLRPLIDPPLSAFGRVLAKTGLSANALTLTGLTVGLGAALAIYYGQFAWALVLVVISRILDGLDGAVARATQQTSFGGYLDIVCDFIFYVSVPVAFGFSDPKNLPYALALTAAFTITGVSFLAFASVAAENRITTEAHGKKSFFYSTGIAEGTETIFFFLLMCMAPAYFNLLAAIFTVLCAITIIQRSIAAYLVFRR